jgi:hypothetical protein
MKYHDLKSHVKTLHRLGEYCFLVYVRNEHHPKVSNISIASRNTQSKLTNFRCIHSNILKLLIRVEAQNKLPMRMINQGYRPKCRTNVQSNDNKFQVHNLTFTLCLASLTFQLQISQAFLKCLELVFGIATAPSTKILESGPLCPLYI